MKSLRAALILASALALSGLIVSNVIGRSKSACDVPTAISELKQTTVGYVNKYWKMPPAGTHWQKGLAALTPCLPTPTATTATTPTPTPQAANWPGNPFPVGSIWNPGHVITSPQVDPNSDSIIAFLLAHLGTARTLNTDSYAVATYVVKGGEPTYSGFQCEYSTCSLDRFGPVPVQYGIKASPGSDGHLAILDLKGGREWDFWKATFYPSPNAWTAGCGNAIYLTERAAAKGICGADDANLPLAAGIIQPEEISAGIIRHPLVFALPHRGTTAPRCPATMEATVDPSSQIVNGMWFQLDPSVNVDALQIPTWQKVVAKAMQDYGMFVRDGSPGIDVYAEDVINRAPTLWQQLGLAGDPGFSSAFPWNRLRVLKAPC